VNCSAKSGCFRPLILNQTREVEVAYGQSATLTLDVNHIGPVTYKWFDVTDFLRPLATTSTPQWQTGPMTASHSYYYVTASSPCGSQTSEAIHIAVINRRRAARH
jgi:Ig-like domain-containing protein